MEGFESNGACVAAYLELFQTLQDGGEAASPARLYAALGEREGLTPPEVPLAPPILRERFGLADWEFLAVMAALALELDGGMRGQFRKRYALELPTVEYALQLISPICPVTVETLAELTGRGALRSLLLTTAAGSAYPLERPLILCRAAFAFLTGLCAADVPAMELLLPLFEGEWLPLHQDAFEQLRGWYEDGARSPIHLLAPRGSGRRTLLRAACGGAVVVELSRVEPMTAADRDHVFREAAVTARLTDAPLCAMRDDGARQALGELRGLCGRFRIPLAILEEDEADGDGTEEAARLSRQLTREERQEAWRHFAPRSSEDSCPEGGMTVGAVAETARLAARYAAGEGREDVRREDVGRAMARRSGSWREGARSDGGARLADMVLPERVREQLRLICAQARSGGALSQWGIPQYREGVTAVFHGPSGTGKTMAARAIAGELGVPLFRADLSRIMDKYVGETEKHLSRLLSQARENRCVLLFDEADALFSRRAEVSSSHDRYANLSTSYLLQEMEAYEGVALLSTNLLGNFDEAFLRRLHYIIHFPLPDAEARALLWRRALPDERVEGEIPYALLARAPLSPARINAAVRTAAIAASAEGRERVDGAGLVAALRLELEKNGKTLPAAIAQYPKAGVEESV